MVLQEGHQLLCCLAESKLQLKQSAWKDPHRGGAVFKVLNEDDIGHGNDEKGEEVEKEDSSVDWNRGRQLQKASTGCAYLLVSLQLYCAAAPSASKCMLGTGMEGNGKEGHSLRCDEKEIVGG